ncbi:hypothetical protein EXM22_00350 [Oceanispirochaeta crateris]|uniref:Uncharacterized protein n=1 Tax=Oceanispirochaeta crateris TaxID=2518645 RepID=A0A5C1QEP7_9SPIO|nr:hypothetical protein [Oceanispirochaeta crateris]QEN06515.1 hypothetical protein EXM22_00350 [Oceanispirochaeta crateris]
MDSGRWVVIISFFLGIGGLLIGLGVISFPWKETISKEHREKELKKVVKTSLLLLLLGAVRLVAMIYNY